MSKWNGIERRTPLRSRKRIKPVTPKERQRRKKWGEVSRQLWVENKETCQVFNADGSRLEGCWIKVPEGYPAHHIKKSRFGDDSKENGLTACPFCHIEGIERNPKWAKERGYWK